MTFMKKINSYTGIRFYWAMTVVVCHLYWIYDGNFYHGRYYFLKNGNFAVTGFFILSGFLVSMHYADAFEEDGLLRQGYVFMRNHIKKWYFLYLVSMVPALFVEIWHCKSIIEGGKLFGRVVLNLLLVQAWIPKHEYSLNRAAWFLSCLCAIYLFTPLILKWNKKIRSKKSKVVLAAFGCLIAIYIWADYLGILYNHPFYRVFQFMLGVFLYDLVKEVKMNVAKFWGYLAIVVQMVVYLIIFPEFGTTINSLVIVFFIAVFYFVDSNILVSGKWIVKLGTISTEIFLLHYPIVVFGGPVIMKMLPDNTLFFVLEQIGIMVTSVLVAIIYQDWFERLSLVERIKRIIRQEKSF